MPPVVIADHNRHQLPRVERLLTELDLVTLLISNTWILYLAPECLLLADSRQKS